jgi:hypothetical protein
MPGFVSASVTAALSRIRSPLKSATVQMGRKVNVYGSAPTLPLPEKTAAVQSHTDGRKCNWQEI